MSWGSWRKRVKLGPVTLNLSGSRRGPGASLSARLGRVTVNTRGGVTARLGRGLTWRGRWRR